MLEQSAKEILWEAVEAPASERAALVRERCGDDATLLARVEELLAAHERSDRLFGQQGSTAAAAPSTRPRRTPDLLPGDRLGGYRVLRTAGAGGFGTVYLAEQQVPVARRVALKVLHTGLGSAAARARFDAERQALARMEHPAIASVHDAGTTPAGQPWFAMEFLAGEPITDYARGHQLGLTETLRLFREVCLAVHHAHQKGVVHRDLKPSNVIVIEVDGQPRPKVIDFGIAKALDGPLADGQISLDGQLVGTPAYMSPEQAAMKGDVDTRSDVYSLGVLLYELLSGVPPFDADTLSFTELIRAIADVDPELPSRRLRAAPRRTGIRSVPPDLDWIAMRCLEKDRTRRYPSANQLAEDVGRFLDGLPVEAAPPSLAYRLRKLAARHSIVVASTGAVLIALLIGAFGTGLGLVRASRANASLTGVLQDVRVEAERARLAEQEAATAAELARAQAEVVDAINQFLTRDLLGAARPSNEAGRGRDVTLREVLDAASGTLDGGTLGDPRFAGQPLVEASIRATLGDVYAELGDVEAAVRHLRRAADLRERELGPEHVRTLETRRAVAEQLSILGHHDEADRVLVPVTEKVAETLGEAAVATLIARRDLGMLRYRQGQLEESYEILRAALDEAEASLSPRGAPTLTLLGSIAIVAAACDRPEEAEGYFRESLARRTEALGEEHPDTINARVNLAAFLRTLGRDDEARRELELGLERQRDVFGPGHPSTGTTLYNLGSIAVDEGRFAEAEELLTEALEISVATLGEDHADTLRVVSALAGACVGLGRRDQAERYLRRAYEGTLAALGELHPTTDSRRKDLANFLYHDEEAREEVVQLIELSYETQRASHGPEHPATLRSLLNLALVRAHDERFEEAESMLREAADGLATSIGPEHPDTLDARSSLAGVFLTQERFEESAELSREIVDAAERALHPGSVDLARYRLRLAVALKELGAPDAARGLAEASHAALLSARGADDLQTRYAAQVLEELGPGTPGE